MKLIQTRHKGRFQVLATTAALQAAMMTLRAGQASDEQLSNEHPASEQWLLVLAGRGTATVLRNGGRRRAVSLRPGSLLIIEQGEKHQIKGPRRGALRTINFYAPPAYQADGKLRRRASRSRA